jgi:hypothetical protein
MKAPQSFIVTPKDGKYKKGKSLGDKVFSTVTSIEDAKDVSKEAIVVAVPMNYDGEIKAGDEVIIHHNIFRAYYNQRGKMTFSRAYIYDDLYHAIPEEVFLYKKDGKWKPNLDYCFVKPIEDDNISVLSGMKLPHTGTIFLSNEHKESSPIGFTPDSEYEVWVDNEMYYRMRDCDVCVYERFDI